MIYNTFLFFILSCLFTSSLLKTIAFINLNSLSIKFVTSSILSTQIIVTFNGIQRKTGEVECPI